MNDANGVELKVGQKVVFIFTPRRGRGQATLKTAKIARTEHTKIATTFSTSEKTTVWLEVLDGQAPAWDYKTNSSVMKDRFITKKVLNPQRIMVIT